MQEEWRPVVGWEGVYDVSSHGRVRTVATGLVLKATPNSRGYLAVSLAREGKKTGKIHVLVAAAFIGIRPCGFVINHLDGNKLNNWSSNLEYTSQYGNYLHAVAGLLTAKNTPKLTPTDVVEIRRLKGHVSMRLAGEMYGVGASTIRQIWDGRRWKHV
jgi:hypothetical protein